MMFIKALEEDKSCLTSIFLNHLIDLEMEFLDSGLITLRLAQLYRSVVGIDERKCWP